MLELRDITLTVEGKRLLEGASARIPAGSRVGIVGRNGCGKTTLFRLIRGEIDPESGDISVPRGARIGGVAQEAPAGPDTLLEVVLSADAERAHLILQAETATDPASISEIQLRLADIDAHSAEARAATVLRGLGFDAAAQARPCADFSGGWRMRVALAAILFARPDILLLDEPTNYLDLEGAAWLEGFLARYPYTALVISHDRALLNRAVSSILHFHDAGLRLYSGGYDDFDATRRARLATEEAERKKTEAARDRMQAFVDRFRAKASKARQAQSRLKALEKLAPPSAARDSAVAEFAFAQPEELAPPILRLEAAAAGYGDTIVLRDLDLRIDQDDRIALLGANGEGKSTLSKLLAGRMAPIAGIRIASRKLRIGYFAQHQLDELEPDDSALAHLVRRRPDESPARLRARLGASGLPGDLGTSPVSTLSGGQRARLSLLLATLDAPHLLIFDEPTNHLDIESREALVLALNEYRGAVILVSHDAHLVSLVADRLWLVRGGHVGPYESTIETYRTSVASERGSQARPPGQPRKTADAKIDPNALVKMRAEANRCEDRVRKLEGMRSEIDARLADPALYAAGGDERLATLARKRAEVLEGLERAEHLWLASLERLEAVETDR